MGSTEVAALREQLSANHLLSSSSFSPSLTSRRRRIFYRISAWAKWLAWIFIRQIMLDAGLLLAFILWQDGRDIKSAKSKTGQDGGGMTFDGAWYISTPGSEGRCRYPNSDCLAYQRSSEKDDFEWFQIKTVTSSRRLESPLMIVD